MRWDNLFDDLEGQLEQELSAEAVDLRAEEERLRLGRMTIRDRLRGIQESESRHSPYAIQVQLTDGTQIAVRPATIGRDWFSADLVSEVPRPGQCVVPLSAVAGLVLTRTQVSQSAAASVPVETEQALSARLTLSFVLRDLCRRRRAIEVRLVGGILFGTIDRVGRDHLDLAVHETGSARRETAVSQYRVVPFAQLLLVRV